MSAKAKRLCARPGCQGVVHGTRCSVCGERPSSDARRESDRLRPSARTRGYTTRWEKVRLAYLREHPLCEECLRQGRVTAATVVHHKIAHEGNEQLFWDEHNWEARCRADHEATHGRRKPPSLP